MVRCKGLLDYTPQDTDILLKSVYTATATTALPADFGTKGLSWGILGNDQWGDCFAAAEAHKAMAQAASAGRTLTFTDASVLRSYAEYLGVVKLTKANDQGTDPTKGAKFSAKVGYADASGRKIKTGRYLFEREGEDYAGILSSIFDFGGINLCLELPESAEQVFGEAEEAGFAKPPVFDYVKGSPVVGGHSITGIGRDEESGLVEAICWGQPVLLTEAFLAKRLQVAIAALTHEQMKDGAAGVSGLDWAALEAAFAALSN